ncbi:MAG: SDR family oxidoreductase [Candidatus Omnitrophota bacterium]
MRFLVTGGAGFIGSHITEKLLKQGHFVRVLDNFSSGKIDNLFFTEEPANRRVFELIKGDIRNTNDCLNAAKGVDFILHQAALRSVPKSLENPAEYNEVNIDGTLNILNAALKNKVKRLVFASSSSVYGESNKFPERETDAPLLISPYALTKLAGEYYCRIFSMNYGLETACLRYFNVFGPRQGIDDEYAVVVPKFITMMLNDQQPTIHGTGRQSRDFTFIDNVVSANIECALSKKRLLGDVFNIGVGFDNTILNLVRALNKIMQKKIKPVFIDKRPGDVEKTLASIAKAKKIIGWQPTVNFEQGLKMTVDWFKQKCQ